MNFAKEETVLFIGEHAIVRGRRGSEDAVDVSERTVVSERQNGSRWLLTLALESSDLVSCP